MSQSTDATDWERLVRYVTGESVERERAAVERWLAEDPSRRRTIDELRAIWNTADVTPSGWDAAAAWSALDRKLDAVAPVRRLPPPSRTRRFAAMVGAGSGWRAAAAIAVIVGAGLLYREAATSDVPTRSAPVVAMREYVSPSGRRAEFTLSDGTRVMLGPDSRLRVPADYGAHRRDAHLEGQAYFQVRHDAARPFLVHTASGVAEDLGTRFDVVAYPGDTSTQVVVAEGKVALHAVDRVGVELSPGQLGRIGATGEVSVRTGVDLARYFAWTEGRLVFERTPLRDALPELSRWYDLDFRLGDSSLATLPLTATFRDQPTPEVLDLLALTLGVRQERDGRIVTLHSR